MATPVLQSSERLLRWRVPAELTSSPAVAYRNRFAIELARRELEELTLSYVYMTPTDMKRLVSCASSQFGLQLGGHGLELGAGCGLMSAVVASEPRVKSMLALEICEEMAKRVIPKVADGVLGSSASKVVPVWGSFDDLELKDSSLDFIVEIDSLHHSDDLRTTLRECFRVLKPGGLVLCFDRCHPDTLSNEEVDRMLNQLYSKEFLIKNCYPEDAVLTRRENGEHEYRFFEWKQAFAGAGFKLAGVRRFVKAVELRHAVKGTLGMLPRAVRRRLYKTDVSFAATLRWVVQYLAPSKRWPDFATAVLAPKDSTVFLLHKP
jgi:ubiquinone/menaquinone biosynthesis C-methylase UbiE